MMTRNEIYQRVVAERPTISIPQMLIAPVAERLRVANAISKRSWMEFGDRAIAADCQRIQDALLSDYAVHECLSESLMLMDHTHGYWHFWDIDGKLISRTSQPKRIAYRLTDSKFWFFELCGYKHLPVIPPQWLIKKLDPSKVSDLPPHLQQELHSGAELWSYAMSPEWRGPVCFAAGYAVVRDGMPIMEYDTIRA